MTNLRFSRRCRIPGILLLLTILYCASAFGAQEPAEQTKHVFRLQYKKSGFLTPVFVDLENKEITFTKEPGFAGSAIVRGALPTGKAQKDFIGFAFDLSEAKLYLDLNRNLDLTDDPAGVFEGRAEHVGRKARWGGVQGVHDVSFNNIPLEVSREQVPVQYLFDAGIAGTARNAFASFTIRSGWQGEIELYGEKWLMGASDNLDGTLDTEDYIYLRRKDAASATPATPWPDFERWSITQNLYLSGHAYDLALAFEPTARGTDVIAIFLETHPALGELRITGQPIERIKLEQGGKDRKTTVILDSPAPTVLVPIATYDRAKVCLVDKEGVGAFSSVVAGVVVSGKEPAELNAGGPLNHRVTVRRRGTALNMDYALVGVGGERYDRVEQEAEDMPPTFAIYRGMEKVASGSFEYG